MVKVQKYPHIRIMSLPESVLQIFWFHINSARVYRGHWKCEINPHGTPGFSHYYSLGVWVTSTAPPHRPFSALLRDRKSLLSCCFFYLTSTICHFHRHHLPGLCFFYARWGGASKQPLCILANYKIQRQALARCVKAGTLLGFMFFADSIGPIK